MIEPIKTEYPLASVNKMQLNKSFLFEGWVQRLILRKLFWGGSSHSYSGGGYAWIIMCFIFSLSYLEQSRATNSLSAYQSNSCFTLLKPSKIMQPKYGN